MATNVVPQSEINALITIILQIYFDQYQVTVDPATVNSQFITARVDTRIGFEINTTVNNDYLKVRLYAIRFTNSPYINPFRQEEVINTPGGVGYAVFVSISDLPLNLFPVLSQTLNPIIDDGTDPNGIQLEDLTGYIQLETGENMELETAQY